MSNEQTLSIIKPDGVERNLVEKIKNIFIKNDLKIRKQKNPYNERWSGGILQSTSVKTVL